MVQGADNCHAPNRRALQEHTGRSLAIAPAAAVVALHHPLELIIAC